MTVRSRANRVAPGDGKVPSGTRRNDDASTRGTRFSWRGSGGISDRLPRWSRAVEDLDANFVGRSNVIVGVSSYGLNTTCAGTGGVYRLDRSWNLDWISATFGRYL